MKVSQECEEFKLNFVKSRKSFIKIGFKNGDFDTKSAFFCQKLQQILQKLPPQGASLPFVDRKRKEKKNGGCLVEC